MNKGRLLTLTFIMTLKIHFLSMYFLKCVYKDDMKKLFLSINNLHENLINQYLFGKLNSI